MSQRAWSIIVWGATGFTGRLIAEHLVKHCPRDLKWAIGGRDEKKLKTLHADLGSPKDVGLFVANPNDLKSLSDMTSQTSVILTAAGPFAVYGRVLLEACVQTKTHYCDITGEPDFVASSIRQYHDKAAKDGTAIVHMCGHDSIPYDLGAYLCFKELNRRGFDKMYFFREVITEFSGGISGGTFATMLTTLDDPKGAQAPSPYSLNPPDVPGSGLDKENHLLEYDNTAKKWTVNSIMAVVDTRVARRSAAILGYGPKFHCDERVAVPHFIGGVAFIFFLVLFFVFVYFRITRSLVVKLMDRAPGKGPSREAMANGKLVAKFIAEADVPPEKFVNGKRPTVYATLTTPTDSGYSFTAVMVSTSAILLAQNKHVRSGVLTPAAAFEDRLLNPLVERGLKFTFDDE